MTKKIPEDHGYHYQLEETATMSKQQLAEL
jgi:hypothetical protein